MANTTNTTSYLDPPSLIGRQNNDGTISLTPLELKRLNDFNYAVSKMIQGGLNLANLNSATNEVFTDLEGNVTSVTETAAGLSVSVSNLSGEVSTVSATVNGLDVTTSGGTTYISGDHIKTGTIEGVTLVSNGTGATITLSDGSILFSGGGGSAKLTQTSRTGLYIEAGSVSGQGISISTDSFEVSANDSISLSSPVYLSGDLNVSQNINSSGAMKLNAGSSASIDAGGTIYIGASSGYSGNVSIGQSGGTINLNGTVMVNGVAL